MRDEDPEADHEVQNIQVKKKENLRNAALKHCYNNYEHCTLQRQLYKKKARQAKQEANNNNNNNGN